MSVIFHALLSVGGIAAALNNHDKWLALYGVTLILSGLRHLWRAARSKDDEL